jgi:hypothetical protein
MSSLLSSLARPLFLGLALAASGATLAAQDLGGTMFDGAGGNGPVTPGVHKVTSTITVPSGKSLTIQAGAILKFAGTQVTANGTLLVGGTTANPVIFTSLFDDTAGGDTNGDGGGSLPAPDQWQGIVLNATSAGSVIDHADIRYTGSGGYSAIHVNQAGADFTLKNSTIRNGSHLGINGNGLAFSPTVTNCTFTGNQGVAVGNVSLDMVPGFTSNTASGNGGNYIAVSSATMGSSYAINPSNCMSGALVIGSAITIGSGQTLTLAAGTVIKWATGTQITANGKLLVNGTAAQPVVLTSIYDDTIAGDTNHDGGSSQPAPDQWQGIVLNTTSAGSVIDHADIRYTGSGGYSAIYVNQAGADFTLKNSTIRSSSHSAINANNLVVMPTVANCAFTSNGNVAVGNLRLGSVPGFTSNTASGNSGNYMQITDGTLTGSLSLAPVNMLNGALVLYNPITINAAQTLTLAAGTVIKWATGTQITANGKLLVNGTLAQPVVLTSIYDDSIAGDTNNDAGGSLPAPDQWQGIVLNATSAGSIIDHADIRYTGSGGYSAIYVNQAGADFTLKNSTIRSSSHSAINANNLVVTPTVTNCTFTANGNVAVGNLRLDSVPGFTGNAATGNTGNYMQITNGSVAGNLSIAQENIVQGTLVMTNGVIVNAGATLHLLPKVHVKMTSGQVTVNGALDVQGTADAPVVFTSIYDDSIDGDTNNDGGASLPAKDQWQGFVINPGAAASTLTQLIVRYTGSGGFAGITNNSPLLAESRVRVEHSSHQGFLLNVGTGPVTDLTAWDCNDGGFVLQGGSYVLNRCTAASNPGSGIRRTAGFTGTVRSSIAFNNGGGGNFDNFTPGMVLFSDGSLTLAGSNGNINADPLFVNAPVGDFTIQKLSPCVDSGDPADFDFGLDQAGFPRFMDGNLDAQKVVDMGAYEFDRVHLAVTGTATPGGTLTVATTGSTGLTTYLFIGLVKNEVPLKQFGPLFMDLTFPNVLLSWVPIPSFVPLAIPAALPTPLPLIFQELGIQGVGGSSPGNLSNPVYVTIK